MVAPNARKILWCDWICLVSKKLLCHIAITINRWHQFGPRENECVFSIFFFFFCWLSFVWVCLCRILRVEVSHESTAPLEIQKMPVGPVSPSFYVSNTMDEPRPPTFRQFETPHRPLYLLSLHRYWVALAFFLGSFSSFSPYPEKFAYVYLDVLSTPPTPHAFISAYGRNMKYNHIKYHFRIIMSEHIFHHQF